MVVVLLLRLMVVVVLLLLVMVVVDRTLVMDLMVVHNEAGKCYVMLVGNVVAIGQAVCRSQRFVGLRMMLVLLSLVLRLLRL